MIAAPKPPVRAPKPRKPIARKPRTSFTCPQCGTVTEGPPSISSRKFCSRACQGKSQTTLSPRPCAGCGKSITPRWRGSRFCSVQCRIDSKVDVTCGQCGKTVRMFPSRVGAKFCSKSCADAAQNKKLVRPCAKCGKEFAYQRGRVNATFCSPKCRGGTIPKGRKPVVRAEWKRLDEMFSRVVRARDKSCQRCGKTEVLQCSHVMPRTWWGVRWNELNAITLCYSCHLFWWHKDPLGAAAWFEEKWPGRYAAVRQAALGFTQGLKPDRAAIHDELTKRLAALRDKGVEEGD